MKKRVFGGNPLIALHTHEKGNTHTRTELHCAAVTFSGSVCDCAPTMASCQKSPRGYFRYTSVRVLLCPAFLCLPLEMKQEALRRHNFLLLVWRAGSASCWLAAHKRLKSGAKVTALVVLSCEPLLLPLTEFFRMMPAGCIISSLCRLFLREEG